MKKAKRRVDPTRPVAVIDIGSNSVRLVVYESAKRSPAPLYNEKVLCGLGRSLGSTGRLDEEGVRRALRALRRFRALAEQLGADGLNIIATAAAREAENGDEFIARAEEICGCEIAVLSGRMEANLAAQGLIAGNHTVNGLAADLGGGSLEIMDIRDQKLAGGVTLPLGGLRLIDLSGGSLKKARKIIDEALAGIDWLPQGEGRPFYGIGGTWRAFARLHMAQTDYPLSVMDGYRISYDEAVDFARLLDHLSPSSLEGISEISKSRRETVPYGALLLERLLLRIRPTAFIISAFGVREGVLYS
ncbi:MAG: Ppx/GppA family phosphatase, partial [Alphaproteobacteria bacterium]